MSHHPFQTNCKHPPPPTQRNLNTPASCQKPWGLTDEKSSPSQHINADLLCNLASNIQKFQIKRRVRKSSHAMRRKSVEKQELGVHQGEDEEDFQELVRSYQKRIDMLRTNGKKQESEGQSYRSNRPPLQETLNAILTVRKNQHLNPVDLKFEQNCFLKGPDTRPASVRQSLQQKQIHLTKYRKIPRHQTKNFTSRSLNPSRQSPREPMENRILKFARPPSKQGKELHQEIKNYPLEPMKIFDIEQLRKTGIIQNWVNPKDSDFGCRGYRKISKLVQRKNYFAENQGDKLFMPR